MNEFDETEEYENLPEEFGGPTRAAKIIKRIFKVVGWAAFSLILVVLFFGMCRNSNDPKSISTLLVDQKLYDAYVANGEKLDIFYQSHDEFTRGTDNYGYFAVTQSVFIRDTDQVQIVLRYNKSTLKYLAEDFPKDFTEIPDRNTEWFDVTLVKVIDLTPDNADDNKDDAYLKYERYSATVSVSEQTGRHNYHRYSFDGVDLDDALEVYVNIYYKGSLDYEKDAYGVIQIYTSDPEKFNYTYKLTKEDKKAFETDKISK
jgi:hypothetical protein